MEGAMSSGDDDFEDAKSNAVVDEFERHSGAIFQQVQDYMEEHDLLEEMMSIVLLSLSVRMRMVGYALESEKPSASGLKLDLDRFRREIDSCIRAAKKDADRFILEAKAARAKAESEADEEQGGTGGTPS
jgi:hypothetical protein